MLVSGSLDMFSNAFFAAGVETSLGSKCARHPLLCPAGLHANQKHSGTHAHCSKQHLAYSHAGSVSKAVPQKRQPRQTI